MDRLDEIISVETYKQISSKLEEQKNKLQEELEEVEADYKQYSDENTSEKYRMGIVNCIQYTYVFCGYVYHFNNNAYACRIECVIRGVRWKLSE